MDIIFLEEEMTAKLLQMGESKLIIDFVIPYNWFSDETSSTH